MTVCFAFVRRAYWRAVWLIAIHSLGLVMLPEGAEREVRADGPRKSGYDTLRRD